LRFWFRFQSEAEAAALIRFCSRVRALERIGCGAYLDRGPETGGRTMTTSDATASAADTRTVARAYFEALGRADRNAQTDWYADDARGHIYGVIGPTGKGEMRSFFHDLFDAFPDFQLEILDLVVDDERAAVRWRVTGTFSGSHSFQGLTPTGKQVDIEGCDMVWVRDGKIARVEAYYDTGSLARQLGAMPPKDSIGERGMLAAVNLGTKARAEIAKRRSGGAADPTQ
jgi:steroid delta-isomerase-like uncharacterized protein